MDVNLFNLQKEVIADYNRLVTLFNNGEKDTDMNTIAVDGDYLEKFLRYLHNSLATVGAIVDPAIGTAFLDGSKVEMLHFDFDEIE